MKDKIRLAYVGVGARGITVLRECFLHMKDVEIAVICDLVPQKCEAAVKAVEESGGQTPFVTNDWKEAVLREDVDAVAFMDTWYDRIDKACFAMEAGKYTAIEVCGAYSLSDCFRLVEVQERTGTPLMMLENCCYGRREMMALKMAKDGDFGEIVHCSCGYCHALPEFYFNCTGDLESNFRVQSLRGRSCDFYPTHGLGPISKILSLNKGNRAVKLSSFASKGAGLKAAAEKTGKYTELDFKQGDVVTTIVTCANGETIRITLDTTLPRAFYSRDIEVRGTKGMCTESRKAFYLEGMAENAENNEEEFYEKYDHPIWKEFSKEGERGGHGGMDWLVCRAFIESAKNGTPPPIDVYDAALWMAITPLSEESIARGGAPVDVPDFTRGKWLQPFKADSSKYSLDVIAEDSNIGIFTEYKE